MINKTVSIEEFANIPYRLEKDMKYVASRTINDLAAKAREEVIEAEEREFDLTRNFIQRSTTYERSSKTNLVSRVGILERAGFMELHEQGGTQFPKRQYLAVRQEAAPRRGSVSTILKRNKVFQNEFGIWRATRRGLTLLFRYTKKAVYPKRKFFEPAVIKTVEKHKDKIFGKHIENVLSRD